ncbi:hypothetical protein F5887DRAFT_986548 [Amanita rubescens]|nr:hypothetical protein F5887DRAFT_1001158 [Amanita rubescens]KAF8332924.1 hypothetical protein F5887DRAFT_995625 [Amanita rubescens]KAF8336788.1 hypothetical protein F5887DRAFT_986548 [Amanita rubescens]
MNRSCFNIRGIFRRYASAFVFFFRTAYVVCQYSEEGWFGVLWAFARGMVLFSMHMSYSFSRHFRCALFFI